MLSIDLAQIDVDQGDSMHGGSVTYTAHGFHDALPGGKASGQVRVSTTSFTFESGEHKVTFPIQGIQFKLGGASDRLLFASHPSQPEWSVYTSDLSLLKDPHLGRVPTIKAQLQKAQRKRVFNWSLVVACVFVVVFVPLFLLANMDWVSEKIARQIPAEWEHSLGESTLGQYKVGKTMLQTDAGEKALAELTAPLLAAVESDRYEFEVMVINSPEVNAFALPGGFIVINAGLIQAADNADEVLGVLAHEIAHVTEQHGVRNVINAAGIFLTVDALFGDVSGVLAMLTNAAPLLINQSYSRRFESEADEHGLRLLNKANINPQGLISFFAKMLEKEQAQLADIDDEETRTMVEDAMGFLSTHPATEDRIADLRQSIEVSEGSYEDYNPAFLRLKRQVDQLMTGNEDNL